MTLPVRVNDELLLDAGTLEESGTELIIDPRKVTLFHQVLDYLRRKPDPPASRAALTFEDEGAAAAAVVLRWGSYFAVLTDQARPVWSETRSHEASRIGDPEMARINIEASAALSDWVDISREDRGLYEKLVGRALAYLPFPKIRPTPQGATFAALAMPEVRQQLLRAVPETRLAEVRAIAESHPSRVFANALVNAAWRNGPVEHLHAGATGGYPIDQRRVTASEERTVLRFAADHLTTGMELCHQLARERPPRLWFEQVLPYGLATMMLITPRDWTLTESTREVRLQRP